MASRQHHIQRKTQATDLVIALACLAIAYLFFSLSVDRGNLFYYLLTLISLTYFLKFCGRLMKGLYSAFFN